MGRLAYERFAAPAAFTLGRIAAYAPWRPAGAGQEAADRDALVKALISEAHEYGADSVADIVFKCEDCRSDFCDGVKLLRLYATGRAVRAPLPA